MLDGRGKAPEKWAVLTRLKEKENHKRRQTVESQRNPAGVTFLTLPCHDLTEYFSIFRRRARLLMPSFFDARLLLP